MVETKGLAKTQVAVTRIVDDYYLVRRFWTASIADCTSCRVAVAVDEWLSGFRMILFHLSTMAKEAVRGSGQGSRITPIPPE
jgi:hypothetical protein